MPPFPAETMKAGRSSLHNRATVVLGLLLLSAACKKADVPGASRSAPAPALQIPKAGESKPAVDPFAEIPPFERFRLSHVPKGFEGLPPQSQAAWIRGQYEVQFWRIQEGMDREELVRPIPPRFKPEPQPRKIKLTLILRDKAIRAGENVWYRFELQNVGRESVRFWELDESFLKNGLKSGRRWGFFVTPPEGKRRQIMIGKIDADLSHRPQHPLRIPGLEGMGKERVQSLLSREMLCRSIGRELRMTLLPGETLMSRPWRMVGWDEHMERFRRGEVELWPKPEGDFRELWTMFDFKTPGRHRIQLVYRDEPSKPPSDKFIQEMEAEGVDRAWLLKDHEKKSSKALGIIESDIVEFEVLP